MTRRNCRLLQFGLPAALGAVMLAAWLLWPRTAITWENYERIQVGMTLAEVEGILGGPARDESTGPLVAASPDVDDSLVELFPYFYNWHVLVRTRPACWTSDRLMVRLDFDDGGRVAGMDHLAVRRADEGILDRLRRWVGL
jgi:hypothetical protein